MKILHIYKCFNDPPKGGVEQFIKQFSLVLKKDVKKNDIFVLGKINKSYSYAKLYSENELFNIASCGIGGISFFIKFYKLMKSYDLFIFHYPWPFGDLLSFLLVLSKKNCRLVNYPHPINMLTKFGDSSFSSYGVIEADRIVPKKDNNKLETE